MSVGLLPVSVLGSSPPQHFCSRLPCEPAWAAVCCQCKAERGSWGVLAFLDLTRGDDVGLLCRLSEFEPGPTGAAQINIATTITILGPALITYLLSGAAC